MKKVGITIAVILTVVMLMFPVVSADWYYTYTKSPKREYRPTIDASDSFNETMDIPVDDMFQEIKTDIDRGVPDEQSPGDNVSVDLKPEEIKVTASDESVDTNETLAEGGSYSDSFESAGIYPQVTGEVTVKSAPDMGYDNYTGSVWNATESASNNVSVNGNGSLVATGNNAYWQSVYNIEQNETGRKIDRIMNQSINEGENYTVEVYHEGSWKPISNIYGEKFEEIGLRVTLDYDKTTVSGGDNNPFWIDNNCDIYDVGYNYAREKIVVSDDDYEVVCYDTDDNKLWTNTHSRTPQSIEATDDYIFYGCYDQMFVYDWDGNEIDSTSIDAYNVNDVDYNATDDKLVIADQDRFRFYSFSGSSLSEEWTTTTGSVNYPKYTAQIDGDTNSVYLGTEDSGGDGTVYRYDYTGSEVGAFHSAQTDRPVEMDTNSGTLAVVYEESGLITAHPKTDLSTTSWTNSHSWPSYEKVGGLQTPEWTDDYFYVSGDGYVEGFYFSNGTETNFAPSFTEVDDPGGMDMDNEIVVCGDWSGATAPFFAEAWTEPYTYTEISYGEAYYVNNSYVDTAEFGFLGTDYEAYAEGEKVTFDETGLESMTLENYHDTATYRLDYDVQFEPEYNASAPPIEVRVELYDTGWDLYKFVWVDVEWNTTTSIEFTDVNYTDLGFLGLSVNESELGSDGHLSFDDPDNNVETGLYWLLRYLTGYSKVYEAIASPQFWGLFAPLLLATAVGAKTRNANVATMSFLFFLGITTFMGFSHPFILFVTIFTFAVYYGIQMKSSSQDTSTGSDYRKW